MISFTLTYANTGEVLWIPGPGQAGDYLVRVTVSDGESTTDVQGSTNTAGAGSAGAVEAQLVSVNIETTPSFPALPGQDVLVHVLASSFGNIASLALTVDGQAVTLDAAGRAVVRATQPGKLTLVATATDIDGFTGEVTHEIKIRDLSDSAAPEVAFATQTLFTVLDRPTDLFGSVADSNLDYWTLEIARHDAQGSASVAGDRTSGATRGYIKLARGEGPIEGSLYRMDTNAWANGVYKLRLTAVDIAGRLGQTSTTIQVASSQKEARYLRTEIDATTTLGGHSFELTRQYDSLVRNLPGTFGYGWRMPISDFQLETDLPIQNDVQRRTNTAGAGSAGAVNLPSPSGVYRPGT
ncbi:MAG TPA: hypothetical protein ENG78_07275 [Acidiferrobacteraceae bacterium]|nr:hypothetical protein [Acidiferrobacteraceae bacterium]HEX20601.1 hypothetical protein [Acidiferrobacteraceae bacterium]